jgi:lycopene beta-cyclase
MVHPATGYQLCRLLASSRDLSKALSTELRREDFDPDAAAAAAYASLWTHANRLQRDFAVFGGEFLGSQPVEILRGFFSAFFALQEEVWAGFLAGWPGLPGNTNHDTYVGRLRFGVSIFVKFPPKVAVAFVAYLASFTVQFGPAILRSIFTPLFEIGSGPPAVDDLRSRRERTRQVYVAGDGAAKREAVEMLQAGRGAPSPQVALEQELT